MKKEDKRLKEDTIWCPMCEETHLKVGEKCKVCGWVRDE